MRFLYQAADELGRTQPPRALHGESHTGFPSVCQRSIAQNVLIWTARQQSAGLSMGMCRASDFGFLFKTRPLLSAYQAGRAMSMMGESRYMQLGRRTS